MESSYTVISKAVKTLKWSILIEVFSRSIQPLTYLVLAKLLLPKDFGLVSSAVIIINFANIFWETGLTKALIQSDDDPDTIANIVFWSNLVLSVFIYVVLYISAPLFLNLVNSPSSLSILRILGFQIIINSISSVQQALIVKELNFKEIFWIKLPIFIIPAFLSIPLALSGFGAWTLVVSNLSTSILSTIAFWLRSRWRPRFIFAWTKASSIYIFGVWVIGEAIAAWFFGWGDNFFVSRYLGSAKLGIYTVGWSIVTLLFGIVTNPVLSVMYSAFSKLRQDYLALKILYLRTSQLLLTITLPMGIGLFIVGDEIATHFFSNQWGELGTVISTIGFLFGAYGAIAINTELYRAVGRPDISTKLLIGLVFIYLPVYLLAAPLNLELFSTARLLVSLFTIPIHIYLSNKITGTSVREFFEAVRIPIVSGCTLLISLSITKLTIQSSMPSINGTLSQMFLEIAVGILCYIVSLWVFDKRLLLSFINLFSSFTINKAEI